MSAEEETAAAYEAYAHQAEVESYAGIRSLFEALAFAERVHARNHERSMRRLGVTPPMTPRSVQANGSGENLRSAMLSEKEEWQRSYPQRIADAQRSAVWEPIRSMQRSRLSESKHYSLIRAVLEDPALWTMQHTYAVCTRCGYVREDLPKGACPVCGAAVDQFALIG